MKWIFHVIAAIVANALGLYLSNRFVPGFHLSGDLITFAKVALTLTLLNLLIKPILKLILSPVIFLTLGLALIAINAFILYALDIFWTNLAIDTILSLLLATLLISVINVVFHKVTQ